MTVRHNASSRAVFCASPDSVHLAVRGAVERHRAGERRPVEPALCLLSAGAPAAYAGLWGFEDGEEEHGG